jgi:hypothetical protein
MPRLRAGYRRVSGDDRPTTWGRTKLLALLACGALAVLLVLVGFVFAVINGLRHHSASASTTPRAAAAVPAGGVAATKPHGGTGAATDPSGSPAAQQQSAQAAEDGLAAQPMPSLDVSAAQPGAVSTADPGRPISLPAATMVGAAGVPTGFPHTEAGAMAQLAAIDQTALQAVSLAGARAVIAGWAMPGGPSASSWSAIAALAGFDDAAGLSGGGSAQLAMTVTPLMGLFKGAVGADFVIPCVDFEVDATLAQTSRVAAADCQRMVWRGDRWMIGPGSEPATPPSVWADTDAATRVGYRDVRRG